ncbi:hypothetical protein [Amycolatopsis methanolica]|uniref:Uncharacterized protein n=1 Tax=Amycolatopsis methanolica 239 TaxID=1068978 RepID=A0A076N0L1_AMYME|nr:hypothetical protein [Amycolatopsis methanolica]AIJ26383.1 hypothetical protein AMETH_6291 [Amycolatopsis methanolica 239]AIJ26442.1 hypothetical protein AMETH_6350 [Amycolatopsis methanolica 239]
MTGPTDITDDIVQLVHDALCLCNTGTGPAIRDTDREKVRTALRARYPRGIASAPVLTGQVLTAQDLFKLSADAEQRFGRPEPRPGDRVRGYGGRDFPVVEGTLVDDEDINRRGWLAVLKPGEPTPYAVLPTTVRVLERGPETAPAQAPEDVVIVLDIRIPDALRQLIRRPCEPCDAGREIADELAALWDPNDNWSETRSPFNPGVSLWEDVANTAAAVLHRREERKR